MYIYIYCNTGNVFETISSQVNLKDKNEAGAPLRLGPWHRIQWVSLRMGLVHWSREGMLGTWQAPIYTSDHGAKNGNVFVWGSGCEGPSLSCIIKLFTWFGYTIPHPWYMYVNALQKNMRTLKTTESMTGLLHSWSQSWHLSITDAPWTQAGVPWSLVRTDSQGNAMIILRVLYQMQPPFSKVGLCRLLGLVLERRPVHPPKKLTPATVKPCERQGREFQLFTHLQELHLVFVSIFTECPRCTIGRPATWRYRSIVIWWVNVSAGLESWDEAMIHPSGEEVNIQHLILLTKPLGSSNAGGKEIITTKSVPQVSTQYTIAKHCEMGMEIM